MVLLEFVENVRDRLLGTNPTSEDELNALMASLKRHVEDSETEIFSAVLIYAWVRTADE